MPLLPCLRRGSQRWWLPLTHGATEAIGHAMCVPADALSTMPVTHPVIRRVHDQLLHDPPLVIFAALATPDSLPTGDQRPSVTGDRRKLAGQNATELSATDLAGRLISAASGLFAAGEAYAGAPPITAEVRQDWNRLHQFFTTIPAGRWLDEADLWLQVLGPEVPQSWRTEWPALSKDSFADSGIGDAPSLSTPSRSMLQDLARQSMRLRASETAFERQLERRKLASLKQLAYGLSHEINNPLANISTRAQQLQRTENDEAKHATLQRIIDQVYRAYEMISDLMFFANPPPLQSESCNVAAILRETMEAVESEAARQSIRLESRLIETPPLMTVDGRMIGEAVHVLLRNAIEAIGCEGTIVVSMLCEPNGLVSDEGPSPPPRRLIIHVADSGPGVSPEARRHALDPYYSGREAGRGLGMGLCRAYRVVRLHHGTIELAGGPAGCVATLTIQLPAE